MQFDGSVIDVLRHTAGCICQHAPSTVGEEFDDRKIERELTYRASGKRTGLVLGTPDRSIVVQDVGSPRHKPRSFFIRREYVPICAPRELESACGFDLPRWRRFPHRALGVQSGLREHIAEREQPRGDLGTPPRRRYASPHILRLDATARVMEFAGRSN